MGHKVGLRKKKIAPETTPLAKKDLKAKIKELRKLEQWAFRLRHRRTDFYEYLKGVHNLCDWAEPKTSGLVGRRIAKLCHLNVRAGTTPIRIVIDATAPTQDRQTKSRWAQALEYAISQKARTTGLKTFFKKHGGSGECASAMAALRKKRKRGWARK